MLYNIGANRRSDAGSATSAWSGKNTHLVAHNPHLNSAYQSPHDTLCCRQSRASINQQVLDPSHGDHSAVLDSPCHRILQRMGQALRYQSP